LSLFFLVGLGSQLMVERWAIMGISIGISECWMFDVRARNKRKKSVSLAAQLCTGV